MTGRLWADRPPRPTLEPATGRRGLPADLDSHPPTDTRTDTPADTPADSPAVAPESAPASAPRPPTGHTPRKQFQVQVFDVGSGSVQTLTVTASSAHQARAAASTDGAVVLGIAQVSDARSGPSRGDHGAAPGARPVAGSDAGTAGPEVGPRHRSLSWPPFGPHDRPHDAPHDGPHPWLHVSQHLRRPVRLDITAWCRELRTLVGAGMTVVEALDTLGRQGRRDERDRLHRQLLGALGQGRRLSDAMAASDAFPPLLLAGVRAGERTSGLVPALDDYLRQAEALSRLRSRAWSAAVYPMVVAGLGALITVVLLVGVVPRFAGLYADAPQLSAATRALLAVSAHLVEHGAWWLAGLMSAGIAASLAMPLASWLTGSDAAARRWRDLRRRLWRGLEGWPLLGPGVRELQRAQLYQSLALMYRGGYALDEALAECGRWSPGSAVADGADHAIAELQRGRPVSAALSSAGLTDAVAARLLAVGERTGRFDHVLQTIADRHAERFGHFLDRTSRLVEPLLLLAVALLVGSLVLLMYMPIFDMAGAWP